MSGAIISLIAARARNGVIGFDGAMPWRMAGDLAFFKRITMGKPLIMGRKTWESLPGLLPGRPHFVISRTPDRIHDQRVTACASLDEALADAQALEPDEIIVIGGAKIYRLALPLAGRLYITEIDAEPQGDTYFPSVDEAAFTETERIRLLAGDGNDHAATIRVLEKR